jgi:hypothetical protein
MNKDAGKVITRKISNRIVGAAAGSESEVPNSKSGQNRIKGCNGFLKSIPIWNQQLRF